MGWRDVLTSLLRPRDPRTAFQGNRAKPNGTLTVGMNSKKLKKREYGNKEKDIVKRRKENDAIYSETAMGTIIDSRVNTFLGSGYTLYAPKKMDPIKDMVQDELDRMGFDEEIALALTEGYKQGYGWMEIAPTLNGDKVLVTRSTENILPVYDPETGDIVGWKQVLGNDSVMIPNSEAVVIVPIPHFKDIGVSLIERARKEIDFYEDTNEASAAAIGRMGYPYVEYNVTGEGNMPVDVPQQIGENARGKGPMSDFITGEGLKMIEHSINGVAHVKDYQDFTLRNIAIVTGTPLSELGITENSESTANRHYQAYYKRISSEQAKVAAQIQDQIINRIILRKLGLEPGVVTFEFDNPDSEDLKRRAETVSVLMKADPYNPYAIITPQQAGELVLGKKYVTEDTKTDTEAQEDIVRANEAIQSAMGGAV